MHAARSQDLIIRPTVTRQLLLGVAPSLVGALGALAWFAIVDRSILESQFLAMGAAAVLLVAMVATLLSWSSIRTNMVIVVTPSELIGPGGQGRRVSLDLRELDRSSRHRPRWRRLCGIHLVCSARDDGCVRISSWYYAPADLGRLRAILRLDL